MDDRDVPGPNVPARNVIRIDAAGEGNELAAGVSRPDAVITSLQCVASKKVPRLEIEQAEVYESDIFSGIREACW